ncbi:MAG: Eco57I restriction-modification methylase domain-containing protein [Thermodesulfovibrionales bacterium]|nr:Eco57I restriction-modification methylase domain-containing protein [Thermodesulfovibrionales bacterium]
MLSNIDTMRIEASSRLHPTRKSALGQFMTPNSIAEFMVSLFDKLYNNIRLLDAGAGIGSLALAFLDKSFPNASSIHIDAWEVEQILLPYLKSNLIHYQKEAMHKGSLVQFNIHDDDFIESAVLSLVAKRNSHYTHCIINPPYKKISSDSKHRFLLRKIGIETVNLYTAFLALCILLLQSKGQMVAIVPRSFCNGTYYKPFRRFLLETCCISHIHVFGSRKKAFKDEGVLQENIIIKLIKNHPQSKIRISTSHDDSLSDYNVREIEANEVIMQKEFDFFIHIPTEPKPVTNSPLFENILSQISLGVSTGPVVDFRVKKYCSNKPNGKSVPLLYPQHFSNGELTHPKEIKKPSWITVNAETIKWLMPKGFYTLVKRFSAKEEKRRIVAYVVNPHELAGDYFGFENHFNVFHVNKHEIDENMAYGLALFLNSSLVDNYFRTFSGHTQVNANDLRLIKYPSKRLLMELGRKYKHKKLTQSQIDQAISQHE